MLHRRERGNRAGSGRRRTARAGSTWTIAGLALLGAASVGIGCGARDPGGRARPVAPSARPAPPPAEDARPAQVVAFASGASVCTARLVASGLEPRGCVALGGAPKELALLGGGEEIYALLASGEVARVREGRVERLGLPPPERLEAPAPGKDDDAAVATAEGALRLVTTASGELWLSRCVWSAKYDGTTCLKSVYARIVPEPAPSEPFDVKLEPPAGAGEPALAAPAAYSVRVLEGPDPKVECEGRGARSTFAAPRVDGTATLVDVRWPSPASPYYLVRVVHDYLEAKSGEVLLMKACSPEPIARVSEAGDAGEALAFGPDGLWAHPPAEAGQGWILRRGGEIVARLPPRSGRPAFARAQAPDQPGGAALPVAPSPPVTRR